MVEREDGSHVLRQQVDKDATGVGSAWSNSDAMVTVGDKNWMNYDASIDVLFESDEADAYAAFGIRETSGSNAPFISNSAGYSLIVYNTGNWFLVKKSSVAGRYSLSSKALADTEKFEALKTASLASGTLTSEDGFKSGKGVWNNLRITANGAKITAYINDKQVAEYTDEKPITSGRIALACPYYYTQFDNLKVMKIKDTVPYYTEYIDNMEYRDRAGNEKLIYTGNCSNTAARAGMFYNLRSCSWLGKGNTLSYTFTGTGFDLICQYAYDAANKNSTGTDCTIKVTVDGEAVDDSYVIEHSDASAEKAAKDEGKYLYTGTGYMNAMYSCSGLTYGEHTMKVEVLENQMPLDVVAIHGPVYTGDVEMTRTETTTSTVKYPNGIKVEAGDEVIIPQTDPVEPTAAPADSDTSGGNGSGSGANAAAQTAAPADAAATAVPSDTAQSAGGTSDAGTAKSKITINLKNKKTYKKTKKVTVKSSLDLKTIKINSKKLKVKSGKTKVSFKLSTYKKYLKKKGKLNTITVTDAKGKKLTVKFKVK